MKKIFYLIPVYNAESTIPNSLTSISSFKYNLEIIVINDNSSDGSYKLLENIKDQFPYPIHLINNKKNIGISSSLNLGIEMAIKSKADYLIRLDADDFNQEGRTDIQVDFMERNPNIMICTSNAYILKDKKISFSFLLGVKSYFENLFRPFSTMLGSIDLHPTFCMRIEPFRDLKLRYGSLPHNKKINLSNPFMKDGMEDLLLISAFIYYYGFNCIYRDSRKKLITYRVNKKSLTPSGKTNLNDLLNIILESNSILYLNKPFNNNLFRLCRKISDHHLKKNIFKSIYTLIGFLIVKLRFSNFIYKIIFLPIFIFTIPRLSIQYMRK